LEAAPAAERGRMIAALEQGLQDRPSGQVKSLGPLFGDLAEVEKAPPAPAVHEEKVPPALQKQLAALWKYDTTDAARTRLSMRLGRPAGHDRAAVLASDSRASRETRLAMIQALGGVGKPACVAPLLKLVGGSEPEVVQLTALGALQRFEADDVAPALLRQ